MISWWTKRNHLAGWDTKLVFDSNLLAVTGVEAGGFLSSEGQTEETLGPLELAPGNVAIGGYTYGFSTAASGAGTLAQVTMEALSAGQTTLDFVDLQAVSNSMGIVTIVPASGAGSSFEISDALSMAFVSGWNLKALPVALDAPLTAQAWLDELNSQGGNCTEVDRWLNGGWDAHINGLPFNDFLVELGKGYFLKCAATASWTFQGTGLVDPVVLALQPGWNLISIPHPPGVYAAQALLDGINSQGGDCSEIDRWLNGGWDAHINGLPFNDYAIEPNMGYFVRCLQASVFTP